MKKILLVGASILLIGCANETGAIRTLEGAGYTDVNITGFRIIGCGEDDLFRTGFKATGPTGKQVTGVVCGGLLKGSTIRMD